MAAGDCTVFDAHLQNIGRAIHNLETGVIRMGIIDSTLAPTAADADPHWNGTGTTDESVNEVTEVAGNYDAEGETVSGTYSQAAGTATFDLTDVSILVNASNPPDCRWGVVYDDTATNNNAIGFLDLGAVIDMTAGDFTVTWSANGFYQIA